MKPKLIKKSTVPPPAAAADLPPPRRQETAQRRARRNADAYTGFVVMSALSTGIFLTGAGLTLWSGVRYGKATGTEQLLRMASKNSDELFDEAGDLSRDAQETVSHLPGLYGMMKSIESRAGNENQDIQQTIGEMRDEARAESKKQQKVLVGSAIVAGVGVIGMLVFISAAKIARHRGLMLFDRPVRGKLRAELAPRLSPQELGLQWTLRF